MGLWRYARGNICRDYYLDPILLWNADTQRDKRSRRRLISNKERESSSAISVLLLHSYLNKGVFKKNTRGFDKEGLKPFLKLFGG